MALLTSLQSKDLSILTSEEMELVLTRIERAVRELQSHLEGLPPPVAPKQQETKEEVLKKKANNAAEMFSKVLIHLLSSQLQNEKLVIYMYNFCKQLPHPSAQALSLACRVPTLFSVANSGCQNDLSFTRTGATESPTVRLPPLLAQPLATGPFCALPGPIFRGDLFSIKMAPVRFSISHLNPASRPKGVGKKKKQIRKSPNGNLEVVDNKASLACSVDS